MAKAGSTIAGLMDALELCFGQPSAWRTLKVLCDKLSHTRFEPSGWTGNAEIGYAKSIMDYFSAGWNCGSYPETTSLFGQGNTELALVES